MPLTHQKYLFPKIICKDRKTFDAYTKKYLHTLSCANSSYFEALGLDVNQIHDTTTKNTQKYIAAFLEEETFGVMAYGEQGIQLAKAWYHLLGFKAADAVKDSQINEETHWTPKVLEEKTSYQCDFWIPMSPLVYKNGFWYYKDYVADFRDRIFQQIKQSYIDYSSEEKFSVADFWLVLNQIEFTQQRNPHVFSIKFSTNINLPNGFHLGQSKGNGFGYFEKLSI